MATPTEGSLRKGSLRKAQPCVDVLLAELAALPAYLAESARLVGDIADLKKSLAKSIGAKIDAIDALDLRAATDLKKAMGEISWAPEESSSLAGRIDTKLDSSPDAKRKRRDIQECKTWELYPTESDWLVLSNKDTPWSIKFDRVKTVCKRIGLFLPSETTRGRMLEALLLANSLPCERDAEFFHLYSRLKNALECLQKDNFTGGKHIHEFPVSPVDLAHYDHSYRDSPPAMREFPELGETTRGVRKSSREYKRVAELVQVTPNTSAHDTHMDLSRRLGQSMPMSMIGALIKGLAAATQMPPEAPAPVLFYNQQQPTPSRPAALGDKPTTPECAAAPLAAMAEPAPCPTTVQGTPAPGTAIVQGAPASHTSAVEGDTPALKTKALPLTPSDSDAQMREALKARAISTGAPQMKRPAASTASTSTTCAGGARARTAENEEYTRLSKVPWTAADMRRDRNTFQCLWYNRQKKLLKDAKVSEAVMKEELRYVCALAGKTWDKHRR